MRSSRQRIPAGNDGVNGMTCKAAAASIDLSLKTGAQ
jgi:hypothetical protein